MHARSDIPINPLASLIEQHAPPIYRYGSLTSSPTFYLQMCMHKRAPCIIKYQDCREGENRVAHVLADTAAHAGGVVGDHSTNHAGVDGGRVGANLVLDVVLALGLVPGQQRVDLTTNQSWLNSDAATIALQIRKLFWSGHVCTTCSWKGLEVQSRLRETLFCRCAR